MSVRPVPTRLRRMTSSCSTLLATAWAERRRPSGDDRQVAHAGQRPARAKISGPVQQHLEWMAALPYSGQGVGLVTSAVFAPFTGKWRGSSASGLTAGRDRVGLGAGLGRGSPYPRPRRATVASGPGPRRPGRRARPRPGRAVPGLGGLSPAHAGSERSAACGTVESSSAWSGRPGLGGLPD